MFSPYGNYMYRVIQTGTWTQKLNESAIINIFVTPKDESSIADGSFSNPYGHIAKALMAAEEKSAEYTSATIYIYLINGDH